MKFKCINYFIFIFLIKYISLEIRNYELRQYSSYETRDNNIVFNPTGFNVGDKMYFKITAKEFNDDYLSYEYSDNLDNYTFSYNNNLFKEKYYHKTELGDDDDKSEIRFYTIVKRKDELKDLEGKYLILYFDVVGRAEIKNTEKDEGKRNYILSIIFGIVGTIIVCVFLYCCFCRKKSNSDDKYKNELSKIKIMQENKDKKQNENDVQNLNENENNYNRNNNNLNNNNNYSNQNNYNNQNIIINQNQNNMNFQNNMNIQNNMNNYSNQNQNYDIKSNINNYNNNFNNQNNLKNNDCLNLNKTNSDNNNINYNNNINNNQNNSIETNLNNNNNNINPEIQFSCANGNIRIGGLDLEQKNQSNVQYNSIPQSSVDYRQGYPSQ